MLTTQDDLEEKVFRIISLYHEKTNGKCGINMLQIVFETKESYVRIRTVLNRLFQKKRIIVRQGINYKLLFLNDNI